MGVWSYLGMVALCLGLAVVLRRIDPAVVGQLRRRTGVGRIGGWTLVVGTTLWLWLPLLFGARTGDDRLWVLGVSLSGVGVFLLVVAVTAVDEYRTFRRATHREPTAVGPATDGTVVATSGRPACPADSRTPFTEQPAVHAEWTLQRRAELGTRTGWRNVASGV